MEAIDVALLPFNPLTLVLAVGLLLLAYLCFKFFKKTTSSKEVNFLSSMENPVIAVDHRFRLTFANPAARALFRIPTASSIAHIDPLLLIAAMPVDYQQVARELRHHQAYHYEIAFGNSVYLCALTRLEQRRGWMVVLTDVRSLKEADRQLSEKLLLTSHDLKNPLQAAFANLDLLRDDLTTAANPEIYQSIDALEKQLTRMDNLVRNILDLEWLRTRSLNIAMCHPSRIIENALDELREFAQERCVSLDMVVSQDVPSFPCDEAQVQRAIVNLVENAIKYTPTGGRVKVQAQPSQDAILFTVADNGVGIPEAVQPHLFERFYRPPQMEQGSGLGLSLVKAVVEKHGGRVWLTSKEQIGTTVFVSLPVEKSSDGKYRTDR